MLRTHPEGVKVRVTVPYVDANGDPIAPASVTIRVLDELGQVIVPALAHPIEEGETEAEVEVAAEHNCVADGATRSLRVVEATLVTAAGETTIASERYVIVKPQQLVFLRNSFQTYDQAILLALDMPRMDGWLTAGDTERIGALIESYERLTRLGYRVRVPLALEQSVLSSSGGYLIEPRNWPEMTPEIFNRYPEHFRRSLAKAQIAEADVLLNGDVITGRRRAGLMSETVGESSMMFRPGKPMELGLSQQTLAYLTGYLEFRQVLGRV